MTQGGIIQKVFEDYFGNSYKPYLKTMSIAEFNGYLIELEKELIAEIEKEFSYMQHGIDTSKLSQYPIDLLKEQLIGNGESK